MSDEIKTVVTDEEISTAIGYKFTVAAMVAIPIAWYFFQDSILETINVSNSFSMFGVKNFIVNIIFSLIFQVAATGASVFLMAVETPIDFARDTTDILGGRKVGLIRMLWNLIQTIISFGLIFILTPSIGFVQATLVGLGFYLVSELVENFFLGTSILHTMKVLKNEHKFVFWTVLLLTLGVVSIQFLQITDAMTRWHIIYGQDVSPTAEPYNLPEKIDNIYFVKNGNGQIPTLDGQKRYLTKIAVDYYDEKGEKGRTYLALISSAAVFSKQSMQAALKKPMFVCDVQLDRSSIADGIDLFVSTEKSIPKKVKDFDDDIFK